MSDGDVDVFGPSDMRDALLVGFTGGMLVAASIGLASYGEWLLAAMFGLPVVLILGPLVVLLSIHADMERGGVE